MTRWLKKFIPKMQESRTDNIDIINSVSTLSVRDMSLFYKNSNLEVVCNSNDNKPSIMCMSESQAEEIRLLYQERAGILQNNNVDRASAEHLAYRESLSTFIKNYYPQILEQFNSVINQEITHEK